jgi:hypothetical protein
VSRSHSPARPLVAELGPEQLRSSFPADAFPESTAGAEALSALSGQQRAQDAIAFGLGMTAPG